MLLSLWRKWTEAFIRHQSQTSARRQARVRNVTPIVELLEDRGLLSVTIAEFPTLSAGSAPYGITTGPDGNIWFTENQTGKIGMINPTTHAVSEFALPDTTSSPAEITAGPDGNLWFTELDGNRIGMINPTTHVVTEFTLGTTSKQPFGIAAGPDGNIWFTELAAGQIGMINPTTHAITELRVPTSVAVLRPTSPQSSGRQHVVYRERRQ